MPSLAEEKTGSELPEFLDQRRIISVKQMATVLGLSVVHLRRLYRNGRVPPPISIGGRKLGWPASVVIKLTTPKDYTA